MHSALRDINTRKIDRLRRGKSAVPVQSSAFKYAIILIYKVTQTFGRVEMEFMKNKTARSRNQANEMTEATTS